jgi:predicted Zn-ribbon and HTH transcriptional regulator
VRITAAESSGQPMVIDHIMTLPDGQSVIVLRDGTTLELSDNDVEMLEMAFPAECENCGYDPNEEVLLTEGSADDNEEEEEQD